MIIRPVLLEAESRPPPKGILCITLHKRVKQMAGRHSYEWWRPDALLPALIIVGPYYFNKVIYAYFPGYPVFVATDYACRTFSLAFLYLLLRSEPTSLPIPWRLAVPSTKELLIALIGAITLIGSNVVGTTFIQYLKRSQLAGNKVYFTD